MTTFHTNREKWENRSIRYGTCFKSVLFKGLPDVINDHINNFHINFILNNIEEKENLRILDIGCGYGRLSLPIVKKFTNAYILGIDISETFVDLFRKVTNQNSFVGTIENLSSDIGKFDYIICSTVLMYVEKHEMQKSICNIFHALKHEGTLLLIENDQRGYFLLSFFGIIPFFKKFFKKSHDAIDGYYFKKNEIEKLIRKCHEVHIIKNTFPFTTFFILPTSLISKFFPECFFTRSILKLLSYLDEIFRNLYLPSLHIGYVIKNDNLRKVN